MDYSIAVVLDLRSTAAENLFVSLYFSPMGITESRMERIVDRTWIMAGLVKLAELGLATVREGRDGRYRWFSEVPETQENPVDIYRRVSNEHQG